MNDSELHLGCGGRVQEDSGRPGLERCDACGIYGSRLGRVSDGDASDRGARAERDRIVAWLRSFRLNKHANEFADAIERGEHTTPQVTDMEVDVALPGEDVSQRTRPRRKRPCPHEGQFKAISNDSYGNVSKLYCDAHVKDWCKCFPKSSIVQPRKAFPDDRYACAGDWMIPGEVEET